MLPPSSTAPRDGAAGFIGAHLVNRLSSTHAGDIIVLDNLHRGYSRDSLPSSVDFHRADVRDQKAVRDAVRGCDIVFHLAAQSNVLGTVADSSYAFTTNVVGTHVVLEAAAIAGVKGLVLRLRAKSSQEHSRPRNGSVAP